jgi:hypothetical protein
MSSGVDCYGSAAANAANIKSAGYSFVCRYYTSTVNKRLTKAEAQALSSAGLFCVSVWEESSNAASYFTSAQGTADATAALNYATNTIGQPANTPVYFAVDFDASDTDITNHIIPYFQAVEVVFETSPYVLGVYGSGAVCAQVYASIGIVNHTWMSGSTGWRNYSTYTAWNIKQGNPATPVTIGGQSFDTDAASTAGGGGWQIS